MKIFIWQDLENLTRSYHDSGGLVVVAESLERAWQLNAACKGVVPDKVFELVGDASEESFVFPDAGCC